MSQKENNPYKLLYMPEHPEASSNGCVYEHRIIAEEILGRKLKDGEAVHHIDENKKNNNPNNLMIFSSVSDHAAFHAGHPIHKENGVWFADPIFLKCEMCNKEFALKYTHKGKHIFCSKACMTKYYYKNASITKDELLNIILCVKGNFRKAGEILGISDNAVRHLCRARSLPMHSSDYKNK